MAMCPYSLLQKGKNDEKAELTRKRILIAARKEFALKGYDSARMNSIAKAGKVNKAMIHYYFVNKEGLYETVLQSLLFVGGIEHNVIDKFKEMELSSAKKLYLALYSILFLYFEVQDDECRQILVWEMISGNNFIKKLAKEIIVPRLMFLKGIVEEGIEKKEFACDDPLFVIWNILSFTQTYSLSRDIYANTPIGDQLFNEENFHTMLNRMANHTFKVLSPLNQEIRLPTIPQDVLQLMKESLQSIKENRDENLLLTGVI